MASFTINRLGDEVPEKVAASVNKVFEENLEESRKKSYFPMKQLRQSILIYGIANLIASKFIYISNRLEQRNRQESGRNRKRR